jgi:hypothetical protein
MEQNRNNNQVYVKFNQPFPNMCVGVVITQSRDEDGSTANLAIPVYDKNGFLAIINEVERRAPVSWIAFGY